VVHVGALSTDEATRLAEHAEHEGADAVSAVPPFAFGKDPDGIKAHYRAIGEACGLPLYLYNIPSLTGIHLRSDLVASLLELPNVRGMKFSDTNLFEEYRAMTLSDRFDVFHGSDETLLYGLMMGAVGGIGATYNFMPGVFTRLYAKFREGDYAQANEIQLKISRFVKGLLAHCGGNFVGLGKMLMGMLGFDCGQARAPNAPIPKANVRQFKEFLEQINFFKEYV
jgi:N-acetylneuraminate lyase